MTGVDERRIIVTPRAERHIEAAARWWRDHRDKAPLAFDKELQNAFDLMRAEPMIGRPANDVRLRNAHRFEIKRIRYYVYYRVIGDDIYLALWHTSRRPPKL
jgi:plasmid stabilization system protein ParE